MYLSTLPSWSSDLMLGLFFSRVVVGGSHCHWVLVACRDSHAESSARVHLSKGEISFTFFKEEGNRGVCVLSLQWLPDHSHRLEMLRSAGVCR